MKRFYLTFTLPILLLAVSCSDSDTPGGEPSPSDPREECRFSNVKATPAATSADFSASYLYLGGFLVKENGFVCTPAGGGAPVTVVCERSTEPACTLQDLAPETDYELYCYVVAGGHTFRSETISFTTLEKGEEPEPTPDNNTRHKGWAELPNEVSNGDYLYVDHECAMEKGARARNFTACYSKSKLCPVWVAAPLHDAYAKKNVERKNSYKDDPDLPYEQVGKWDGYTRGHMLGSAERLVSREANSQVMYFSNIGPQLGQNDYFNGGGGQWNTAEDWVDEQWRGLADTCYQVVGCYWANTNKKVSGTTIPTHYFTVLLKAKKSAGKKWVVNCTRDELQCIALFIEHKSYSKNAVTKPAQFDSKGIFMRVSDLEAKTGHKFFMNVPNAPKDTYDTRDWNF